MNRRRLLAAAGAGVGSLGATAFATRDAWLPFDGRLRVGLAPVVPASYRAADREAVLEQLRSRLSPLVDLHVERAPNEWHLVRGLADGEYDVAELGAVAGVVALESGLAEPLVQPTLDGAREYEGRLLAASETVPYPPPENRRIAVGEPLSTPAHAALGRPIEGDVTAHPTPVRWHELPPRNGLGDDAVALAASDEFHAPPGMTVHRSYPMPVPALYVRDGIDPDALRQRLAAVAGGPKWFRGAQALTGADCERKWLGDAPEWLADASLPAGGDR